MGIPIGDIGFDGDATPRWQMVPINPHPINSEE
jgi:hypothetical protein